MFIAENGNTQHSAKFVSSNRNMKEQQEIISILERKHVKAAKCSFSGNESFTLGAVRVAMGDSMFNNTQKIVRERENVEKGHIVMFYVKSWINDE